MEFVESYMLFVFDDEHAFRIEDDPSRRGQGLKVCECVALMGDKATMIEAKSSSPQPKSESRYQEFFAEIVGKFSDTLTLYRDMQTGAKGKAARHRLPPLMQEKPMGRGRYALYLVVHGNDDTWMPGLQDTLREMLREVTEQWGIDDTRVKALNHSMAKDLGVIAEFVPLAERRTIEKQESDPNKRNARAERWLLEHRR